MNNVSNDLYVIYFTKDLANPNFIYILASDWYIYRTTKDNALQGVNPWERSFSRLPDEIIDVTTFAGHPLVVKRHTMFFMGNNNNITKVFKNTGFSEGSWEECYSFSSNKQGSELHLTSNDYLYINDVGLSFSKDYGKTWTNSDSLNVIPYSSVSIIKTNDELIVWISVFETKVYISTIGTIDNWQEYDASNSNQDLSNSVINGVLFNIGFSTNGKLRKYLYFLGDNKLAYAEYTININKTIDINWLKSEDIDDDVDIDNIHYGAGWGTMDTYKFDQLHLGYMLFPGNDVGKPSEYRQYDILEAEAPDLQIRALNQYAPTDPFGGPPQKAIPTLWFIGATALPTPFYLHDNGVLSGLIKDPLQSYGHNWKKIDIII